MPPFLATIVYCVLIVALFVMDRERKPQVSRGLWLPVIWLWIVGSRELSGWLGIAGVISYRMPDPTDQLEGNPIDRLVYLSIIVLGLIVLSKRPGVARLLNANLPILLFFFYCALSIFWSEFPFVAFKRFTKAVGDLVMILIILTEPNWIAAFKRLLCRQGYLLIPLSVLFIKYYPHLAREYKMWSGKANYTGVTTTKNLLGMLCLMIGLGFIWRFISSYRDRGDRLRTKRLIAHMVLLSMVLWLLWMSNSMTSLACFLMGSALVLMASIRYFQRHVMIIHAVVLAIVLFSCSVLFLNMGGGALEQMGRDPTLTGRTGIWDLVLSIAGNPLFGTGFESFWLGWRLERVWAVMIGIQEAHNGYLEVYLNLGWIGLGLLGLVILTGYRKIAGAFRRDPDTYSIWLTYFVIAIVYSFTEAGFRMMFPVWIFFMTAIMASSLKPELRRESSGTEEILPRESSKPELIHA